MQLAASSPAIPLVQDYATALSTTLLPRDYNLSNIHPVPQLSGETMSSSKNLINGCGDYVCQGRIKFTQTCWIKLREVKNSKHNAGDKPQLYHWPYPTSSSSEEMMLFDGEPYENLYIVY